MIIDYPLMKLLIIMMYLLVVKQPILDNNYIHMLWMNYETEKKIITMEMSLPKKKFDFF